MVSQLVRAVGRNLKDYTRRMRVFREIIRQDTRSVAKHIDRRHTRAHANRTRVYTHADARLRARRRTHADVQARVSAHTLEPLCEQILRSMTKKYERRML